MEEGLPTKGREGSGGPSLCGRHDWRTGACSVSFPLPILGEKLGTGDRAAKEEELEESGRAGAESGRFGDSVRIPKS